MNLTCKVTLSLFDEAVPIRRKHGPKTSRRLRDQLRRNLRHRVFTVRNLVKLQFYLIKIVVNYIAKTTVL
jgi:hypothetical protein